MNAVYSTTDFGIAGAWLAEYTLGALGARVVLFDGQGRLSQWDRTAPVLLGLSERELGGRTLHDDRIAAVWRDGSRVTAQDDPVAAVLRTGETSIDVTIGLRSSGSTTWHSVTLLPIFGVDHRPRAVLASFVEVTERVTVRTSHASWHLALRAMLQTALPAIILTDRDGQMLEWNDQVPELTDRTDVELLGCHFADVCDVDVNWLWAHLDAADGACIDGMTWLLRRRGGEIPVQGRFTAIDHPELGRVAMAQLLPPVDSAPLHDDPRAIGTAVFERSLVPMVLITASGTIVDANPAAATLLQRPRQLLIGCDALDHLDGIEREQFRRAIALAAAGPRAVSAGRCTGPGAPRPEVTVVVSATSVDAPSRRLLVQLVDDAGADLADVHPLGGRPVG